MHQEKCIEVIITMETIINNLKTRSELRQINCGSQWIHSSPWFHFHSQVHGSICIPRSIVPFPLLVPWFHFHFLVQVQFPLLGLWFHFHSQVYRSISVPRSMVAFPFLGPWFHFNSKLHGSNYQLKFMAVSSCLYVLIFFKILI